MDIKRLEEFTVVAQSANFKQAAETLGISPALLSSHISALEKKLGAKLMERDAHRSCLTESGKRFLGDAMEICADYQQIVSSIGTSENRNHRALRIGMSGFAIPAKLGPYLDTVVLKYPDICLDILDDRRFNIADGLKNGAYDVFFTYSTPELQYDGVEKELVYGTKVQVLVPLSHRLANKATASLRDLDGEQFVVYPVTAEPAMRDCELSLLERSGISYTVYDGNVCTSAYYVMVPVGKGLAFCPWTLRNLVPPNTVTVSISDYDFAISMYMFYRKDCANPYLDEFLDGFRSFENRRAGK